MAADMRCVEISATGGPEVLRIVARSLPEPAVGEVLLRVHASGVNRGDLAQRLGHYPAPSGASDIPGLEVSGTIVSADPRSLEAAGYKLGDRVCALLAGGGYASHCVAPLAQCLPVPADLSHVQGAALPETFFTVWSNLFDRAGLRAGEILLVHGGSSGIGVTAIQLAKMAGVQVIVTAGTDEKCEACLGLGADLAINYRESDFVSEVLDFTNGHGADVVLDMVAGDYMDRNFKCMADEGRLVLIAILGGARASINAWRIMAKRLQVTGSTLRARPAPFKAAIAKALRQRAWPWLESGQVRPVVFAQFDALAAGDGWPNGAARAHALMESSQHVGKIILTWEHGE